MRTMPFTCLVLCSLWSVGCTTGMISTADDPNDEAALGLLRYDGSWVVYPVADNAAANISGRVMARQIAGASTQVTLHASGLPANTSFDAHVHKLACNDTQAGGHYQNVVSATATEDNEVWLNLTTDDGGAGEGVAQRPWLIRGGEAKAVVVHSGVADPVTGKKPKLACLDVPFQLPAVVVGSD